MMRKAALASSLLFLALLVLGIFAVHSVEPGAVSARTIGFVLALLTLPYLAFCLARPGARAGWAVAAWWLNAGLTVLTVVVVALALLSGFPSQGYKLLSLCLAVVVTAGINLAALRRARPAGSEESADGGTGGPAGLRGWLLLLGAFIIFAPVRIAVQAYPWYRNLFLDGTWQALGDPQSPVYNPLWQPVIAWELAVNVGLIALWVFIAYLFLSKKKAFRQWFIALLAATPLLLAVDGALSHMAAPDEPVPDPELLKDFFRGLLAVLIWVPYILMSKRVKATFVR